MELAHKNASSTNTELLDSKFEFMESTNPFRAADKSSSDQQAKTGKRPRMQKPIYSVRLF